MKNSAEFSRPVDPMRLSGGGRSYDISATVEERAALAQRFELSALDRLDARVRIVPLAGGFYRLTAELDAELTQACVLSLEPVPNRLQESFSLLYGPVDSGNEVVLDAGAETVEPFEGGTIDIGEAVAQQLSLALDPFPRGAAVESPGATVFTGTPDPDNDSPFAVLSQLRKGREG